MAETDLIIENTSNSKQFLFRAVSMYKPKKIQPPISIPIINQPPSGTLLFKFTGQSEDITFAFGIFNDGVDVSNGTEAGGVTTVTEQLQYLKDTIYTHEFDTLYTLTDNSGLVYASAISGVISTLEYDLVQGAQVVVVGTITFQRGSLAGL